MVSPNSPSTDAPDNRKTQPARRGMIFVTALGIIVVLTGLVLSFAQNMRTEVLASANRLAALQADAIEQGAEQWVMGQVDLNASGGSSSTASTTGAAATPDSWTLVYNTPAEALQVGGGYFWLIRPDEDSDQQYDYGIIDESSKLNLNATTFTSDVLLQLPTNITQDVADAVTDWNTAATKASSDGAETDYYNGLQEPYDAKNQPYETVEEMLLVKGITPDVLYGYDLNRDGVVTDAERQAAQSSGLITSATNDSRGIFRYLTVYSSGGKALANAPGGAAPGGAATTTVGLVNVNTASENVLMALGLTQSQADSLITARADSALADASSVSTALGGGVSNTIAAQMTTSSYQYSADIVAVSGDGRAFKRVRIVVDCTNTPCKIVYRRDLTSLGWPLDPQIRASLRSGQGIQPGTSSSGSSGSGSH